MKHKLGYLAIFLIACLLLGASELRGQQSFIFRNGSTSGLPVDAPVLNFDGNPLSGPNYVAMLYWGTSADSLSAAFYNLTTVRMQPVPFAYMPNGVPGYFWGALVAVPICPPDLPWLQVRAWDVRLGSTYEEVVQQGLGGYGASNLFRTPGGNGCDLTPGPPQPLLGLQSFSLSPVVPEPSSALLLLFGVPWLVWRCRRKN